MEFEVYSFERENSWFSNLWFIYDSSDTQIYTVKHPGFFSTSNIQILDQKGKEALEIRGNFWRTVFTLFENNHEIAKVRKSFSFFKNEFVVTSSDGNEVVIEGRWFRNEFRFLKGEDEFAFVSRKRFVFAHDRYGIAIREGINPLFVLGVVVVIQVFIRQQESSA